MLFTTSWDDGHPLDLRLAELLNRHGFAGTFYVPITNCEGRPVLPVSGLRQLDALCEMGSHTLDHCYLTTVNIPTALEQIHNGRTTLEDALGHSVSGFCYPGGTFRPEHRVMVESAGFMYARTTKNLVLDVGSERFELPTTLQFYPHSRAVYLMDWLRHRQWRQRMRMAARTFGSTDLLSLLKTMLLEAKQVDGTFHIWGHSWEMDTFGGWALLNEFLTFAADHVAVHERVTNGQVRASVLERPGCGS
jgi:peptidoglycan/xylan/chitin deacetylase (PgdA/CDA1 family)